MHRITCIELHTYNYIHKITYMQLRNFSGRRLCTEGGCMPSMWTKEEHPPSLVQRQVPRKQAFGCLRQPSEAHNLIGDISCLHIGLWSWWYLVVLYCKDPYIHNSFFFRKPPWILIDWVYLSDIQMFWNVCFIGPPYVWNVVVVSPQTHECPFQYDILEPSTCTWTFFWELLFGPIMIYPLLAALPLTCCCLHSTLHEQAGTCFLPAGQK